MAAYDVSATTGILSFDDSLSTIDTEMINEYDLLADGTGAFTINAEGHVLQESNAFLRPDRLLRARGDITLYNGDQFALTDEDIVKFSSTWDMGAQFPIGVAVAGAYTLTLANDKRQWDWNGSRLGRNTLDGAKVNIEIGAVGAWVRAGVFYVEKTDSQDERATIMLFGSDAMGNKMMAPWVDDLEYPTSSSALIQSICAQAGLVSNGSAWNSAITAMPTFDTSRAVTMRDLAGWIAGMNQQCAFIDVNGRLTWKAFSGDVDAMGTPPFDIHAGYYSNLNVNVPTSYMNYVMDATPYGESEVYLIEYSPVIANRAYYKFVWSPNPFYTYTDISDFLNDREDDIYFVCGGLRDMASAIITWQGDGVTELLDTVSVTRPNGDTLYVPVLFHRVDYDGGMRCSTGCNLSSATLSYAEVKNPYAYS